jgi:hypothetical protein
MTIAPRMAGQRAGDRDEGEPNFAPILQWNSADLGQDGGAIGRQAHGKMTARREPLRCTGPKKMLGKQRYLVAKVIKS